MKIPSNIPTFWYENKDGDKWYPTEELFKGNESPPEGFIYQVSRFPNVLTTSYVGDEGELMRGRSSWSIDLVNNMVRQGVSVDQAVLRAGIACERCMNALAAQYLCSWGYPEGSEEWLKSNTECEFCK